MVSAFGVEAVAAVPGDTWQYQYRCTLYRYPVRPTRCVGSRLAPRWSATSTSRRDQRRRRSTISWPGRTSEGSMHESAKSFSYKW